MSTTPEPQAQLATTQPKPKPVVLASQRGVQFNSLDDMARFCTAVVNSGQFKDITTPEIALIRLQAGLELGLSPIWSLTNIMVTNGRPTVWGDALLALVQSQPDFDDIIETSRGEFPNDDYTAVCEVRRKGRIPLIREFSIAEAKRANLWKDKPKTQREGRNGTYESDSGPWYSYPKRMLQMRARAFACRDAFADALRGLGVREEQDDVPMKQARVREVTPAELPEVPE